jgi:hypothetical protein
MFDRPLKPFICATIAIGTAACSSVPPEDERATPIEISPDQEGLAEVDPEGLDRFLICGPQATVVVDKCGGFGVCVVRQVAESWPNPDAVSIVTSCGRDIAFTVNCVKAAIDLGRCVRQQAQSKDLDRSTCTPVKGGKQVRCKKNPKPDGGPRPDGGNDDCNDNYHGC